MQRGFFSAKQQRALIGHGDPHSYDSKGKRGKSFHVTSGPRAPFAHAYEGATPDEVLIVTSVGESADNLHFDDVVDLGPVGRGLYGWDNVERHYPTQPMVMRRDQYHSYRYGNLPPDQVIEACAKAWERARENAEARESSLPSP